MANVGIVRGVVVEEAQIPPVGLAGLFVVIGTSTSGGFSELASTQTDSEGEFSFDLTRLPLRAATHVEIRVFQTRSQAALATHGTTRWRLGRDPGRLIICVEFPTAGCDAPIVTLPGELETTGNRVWGQIRHADGTPLSGLDVEYMVVNLVDGAVPDSPPRVTTTDPDGYYSMDADPGGAFQIMVRDSGPAIAYSRAYFGPSLPTRVDVEVSDDAYRQSSEYARITEAVTDTTLPLHLASAGDAADLGVAAVAALSGVTGWDVKRLGKYVVAHKLTEKLTPSTPANAELFYGLVRLGWPCRGAAILARAPSAVEAALARAASRNYIAPVSPSGVADFKTDLKNARIALHKSMNARALKAILMLDAAIDSGKADTFVDEWFDRASEEAFWDEIELIPMYPHEQARRMVTLAIIGLMFKPAVEALLSQLLSDPVEALAEYGDAEWTAVRSALAQAPFGIPGTTEEAKDAVVAIMREHVDDLFGNKRAHHRITTDIPTDPGAEFLQDNPTFDLATSRVEDFSGGSPSPEQREGARVLQRLYKIAPRSGRAETLLALHARGFTSAQSIVRLGRARFMAQATSGASPLDEATAAQVFARAAARHTRALHAYLQLHPRFASPGYAFLPQGS